MISYFLLSYFYEQAYLRNCIGTIGSACSNGIVIADFLWNDVFSTALSYTRGTA